MTLEHGHDVAFERIELAGPLDPTALLIGGAGNPFFSSLEVQLQLGRDLGGAQVFVIKQLTDFAEGLVANHGVPPLSGFDWSTARRMSATDWTLPARFSSWVPAVKSSPSTW